MTSFYADTVTRHRAATVEGIHGGTRDWDNPDMAELTGFRLQQLTAEEQAEVSGTLATYRLLGPYDADIQAGDRISTQLPTGRTVWLKVIGEPIRHRSPYGSANHTETLLGGVIG